MSNNFDPGSDNLNLMLRIARGDVEGLISVNKFGRNNDIDPASEPEDIWDTGGIWVPPTTDRLHDIVSTDAADDSVGIGAQTILVEGLDSNFDPQSETVIMDGLNPVTTNNTYTRIFRMYLLSAGSTLMNSGDITATAQVDATITAQISIGQAQTLMAIYTVPAGMTAFMTKLYANMSKPGTGQASTVDMQLLARESVDVITSPWRVKQYGYLTLSGSMQFHNEYFPYKVFPEKTDIVIRALSTSTQNVRVVGGFDLILIDNDV